MTTPEQIKTWIETNLPDSQAEVTGDGRHFDAVIISSAFQNKSSVQRHQLVYQALGEKMKVEIHALSMKTLTPDEVGS